MAGYRQTKPVVNSGAARVDVFLEFHPSPFRWHARRDEKNKLLDESCVGSMRTEPLNALPAMVHVNCVPVEQVLVLGVSSLQSKQGLGFNGASWCSAGYPEIEQIMNRWYNGWYHYV